MSSNCSSAAVTDYYLIQNIGSSLPWESSVTAELRLCLLRKRIPKFLPLMSVSAVVEGEPCVIPVQVTSSLFWDVTRRRLVVIHGRFGTAYEFRIQGSSGRRRTAHSSWTAWPLKMWTIDRPETSVNNYQCTLCNIPEERRPRPIIMFLCMPHCL